jgi:hypothetical protein
MRNHRLFGVGIAVLLGTSLLDPQSSSAQEHHHQAAGTPLRGAGVRLASAAFPADHRPSSLVTGDDTHIGVLRPAGTRYLEAAWAWASYVSAHTPAKTPAAPAPAVAATYSVAPAATATQPSTGDDTHIGVLRPAGTRYLQAAWAWASYVSAHTPAKAPAAPAPAVAATHIVVTPVAPVAQPAVSDVWAGLRRCESGGNYAENTGNGYYGAYQFSAATWHGLGFPGLPSDASPAVQDRAAQQLQARSGWGQWPSCSRRLRLT